MCEIDSEPEPGCEPDRVRPEPGSPPGPAEDEVVTVSAGGDEVRPPLPMDLITMELELEAADPPPGPETIDIGDPTGGRPMRTIRRRLGRFTVLGVLGRGGMGTVLEAYDDTLARTVALKLLHGRVVQARRERLLREAQALAQLSHPNVVQVYEVGLVEDQMFIAMELVEGENLRQWQKRRRPWRQVVQAYVQAGRGLAAAHARELIHRDFKPENCIISDGGRVCVLDFGLARGSKTVDEPTQPPSRSPDDSSLRVRLTQSGKVLGTLSYLPLQQLCGLPADAMSDQFSFCVSLYEALYGVLPYADRSVTSLMVAQREGRLQPVPRGSKVPRRLRAILLRGLAREPVDRWPSMHALLAALERLLQPRRQRRTVAAAVATLVVGFSAGALMMAGAPDDDPCDDPRLVLQDTWGPAGRQAVQRAYLGSGHPEAPALLQRVEGGLDAYTRGWVELYERSCRDRAAGPLLQPSFERRMRCLGGHRDRLRATVDTLAGISTAAEALHHTVLPFKLPLVEGCVDPGSVESGRLPTEPAQAQRVLELRRAIARADTLGEAGALAEAVELAQHTVDRARQVEYLPVLGEALESQGRLQSRGASAREAEAILQEAIVVAARAHDDATAARAWSSLVHAVTVQDELDRAASLRFAATAAVERSGDPVANAWLLNNLGILHGQRREYEPARSYLERALALKLGMLGPEHLDVGIAWFNLGNALVGDDQLDQAREAFDRARSIFEATVGPAHPNVAFVETGLGHVRRTEGRLTQAAVHHRRALAIYEQALGPEDLRVAKSLQYLGEVGTEQGRLDEAAGHLERARGIYEQALGPESAQVGVCLVSLSHVQRDRGQRVEARALAERALAQLSTDDFPVDRARARLALALALDDSPPQRARARALVRQALEALPPGPEQDQARRWLEARPAGGER